MLLALALALPARADIAVEPDPGTQFITHALRVEGFDAHPQAVLVVHDAGAEISAHRVYAADREAQQDLASGGSNRGGGMGGPTVVLLAPEAYAAWAAATQATVDAAWRACDERGEGCVHISRFVPRYAPPTGTVSCGLTLDLQLSGPDAGPDRVVDVYKLVEASASTCKLEKVGQELYRAGQPLTPKTGGCAVVGSAASIAAGLALLLGLSRRRG